MNQDDFIAEAKVMKYVEGEEGGRRERRGGGGGQERAYCISSIMPLPTKGIQT